MYTVKPFNSGTSESQQKIRELRNISPIVFAFMPVSEPKNSGICVNSGLNFFLSHSVIDRFYCAQNSHFEEKKLAGNFVHEISN